MDRNFKKTNENVFSILKEKCLNVYEKFLPNDKKLQKISELKDNDFFINFLIIYFFDHGHFFNKIIDDYLNDKSDLEKNINFFKMQFYSFKLKDFSFFYFKQLYDFYEIKPEIYVTFKQLEYFTNLVSVLKIPIIHYICLDNKTFYVDNKDFYMLSKIKNINEQNFYIDILLNMI